jgi:hypothetical protein
VAGKAAVLSILAEETKASIANKLARGTFTAPFYLAALVAIGRQAVSLEEI